MESQPLDTHMQSQY